MRYFTGNNRELLKPRLFADKAITKEWIRLLKEYCDKNHTGTLEYKKKHYFQIMEFPVRLLCMSRAYVSAQKAGKGRDSALREMSRAETVIGIVDTD